MLDEVHRAEQRVQNGLMGIGHGLVHLDDEDGREMEDRDKPGQTRRIMAERLARGGDDSDEDE